MKHTKSEILNALQVIKDTCLEKYGNKGAGSCRNCPFRYRDDRCTFIECFPYGWDIAEKETWRAFK